jgi:hypothetical protein
MICVSVKPDIDSEESYIMSRRLTIKISYTVRHAMEKSTMRQCNYYLHDTIINRKFSNITRQLNGLNWNLQTNMK